MIRRRVLVLASLLMMAAGAPDAQRGGGSLTPSGLILGRVVDNDTSAGVPGVVVTLVTVTDAGQPRADACSRTNRPLRVRGLPKGSYSIAT
jgi:hypothetical protein